MMNPDPPPISIIVTMYNRAPFVAAAIGSILLQTRKDFELVIWDDGSTDDSLAVARKAAGDDPRVRIIAGEHAGVAKAFNSAAHATRGKFFGWVDSDDGLVPTAIEEAAAVLEANPGVGMVYSDYLTMNEAGHIIGPGLRTKIPYSKDRLLIDFMTFHFRMMRREVLERIGGMDQSLPAAIDYDLCLRISEVAEIHHLARPLYLYRIHRDSISSAQRLEQIMQSKDAIHRALVRRGMDREFEIDVEIVGKFKLKRKAE
jgi:glycosyltransferase involved in cell wall biosynthesis